MILRSEKLAALPGLQHAFSTRLGGVSAPPYATLNLGRSVGDEPEAVEENLRRFALLGHLPAPLFQTSQVHGTEIAEVTDETDLANLRLVEADALFCSVPRRAVGVRTADCAPLLIAGRDAGGEVQAVAAVHAGWRGATGKIVSRVVERFEQHGFAAPQLTVAIGPTIGPSAFEVGPEVMAAARLSLGGAEPPGFVATNGRPHLDLPQLLALQLHDLGVPVSNIEQTGGCTFDNEAMFFSHRRDRGKTGRHLSAIAFGPAP